MTQPLVSVVVAAYNYGNFIHETLNSVLAQTYSNWECLVIDDGSTDNTSDIVKAFCIQDSRFSYHYHSNRGLPATRNVGIHLAKGDFFQWLDADDLLERDKLKKQIEVFELKPNIDIVYSDLRYFYDGKPEKLIYSPNFNRPWTLKKSGKTQDLIKFMLISCVIMPSMPLLRRQVVEKVGGFNEAYKFVEDWNFWLRIFIQDFNIFYLKAENSKILMRLHANSMTKSRLNMINGFLKLRNEFNSFEVLDKLKNFNNVFLQNDEIEYYLTLKTEDSDANFDFSKVTILVYFFKFIGSISPKFGLTLLQYFKSIQKKYYYFALK